MVPKGPFEGPMGATRFNKLKVLKTPRSLPRRRQDVPKTFRKPYRINAKTVPTPIPNPIQNRSHLGSVRGANIMENAEPKAQNKSALGVEPWGDPGPPKGPQGFVPFPDSR